MGVDPGHTIGLCALNLEGELFNVASLEGGGLSWAVSTIQSWGKPSIIACDVKTASEFAQKLASSFNAMLYVPKKELREDFKRELLKNAQFKYNKKIASNAHERDAFCACTMAFRENQNLIRSALSFKGQNQHELAHLMLLGNRRSDACNKLDDIQLKQKSAPILQDIMPVENATNVQNSNDSQNFSKLKILERKNSQLMLRVLHLENENAILVSKIKSFEKGEYNKISKDKLVLKLKSKIFRLNSRLQDLLAQKNRTVQLESNQKNSQIKSAKSSSQNSNLTNHGKKIQKTTTQSLKGLDSFDTLAHMLSEYRRERNIK